MPIHSLNTVSFKSQQNKYINSKTTGYIATGGIALTLASGLIKSKTLKKNHKSLSIITALLVGFHLFSVEFNKKMYKKSIN